MYDFISTSLNLPFRINLSNLTEIRHTNGAVKRIRRINTAPYPLIKVNADVELFGILDPVDRTTHNVNVPVNTAISKQLPPTSAPSKSKKLFPNLVKSKHQTAATNDSNSSHTVSSSSSSSSKLARQIFNNLNIFSNKQHQNSHNDQQQNSPSLTQSKQQSNTNHVKPEPVSSLRRTIENGHQNHRRLSSKSNSSTASTQNLIASRHSRRSYRSQDDDVYLETDGDSSCYSTNASSTGGHMNAYGIRRPSVDTISTYLSHESNERLHYTTTETTYSGDDDVFLPPPKFNGSIVGVDADSDMISRFVNVVHPEWPKCRPCVICLEELKHNPNNPAVSLIRCEHLMHLNCLNHMIITQSEQQQKHLPEHDRSAPLYIECPVCGIVYGEKYGNQPPGTMTWSIIPKQVAGHEGQNTIQIIYK